VFPSLPARRRARAAVVLLAILLAVACGWVVFLALTTVRGGEPASPGAASVEALAEAEDEPLPLVPRLELGRATRERGPGERPPLQARPVTPPEVRFSGTGRIEGYLDLPPGIPVPARWSLVLEPSRVLIGGDRAQPRRVDFERGETEFTLEDVPLGGYELRAEAERMSGTRELLLLARPDAHDVIVRVGLRPAAFVEGLVAGPEGEPVGDLPMELHALAGGEPLQTHTDARGAYLFESVPDGEYRLFAGHPTSPLAEGLDLAVTPPSLHVPRISVPRLGELVLTVVDALDLPVAEARIEGWGSQGGHVDVTTDALGQARARFLPAGRITLNVSAGEGPARRTGRETVELAAGATRKIAIRLAP